MVYSLFTKSRLLHLGFSIVHFGQLIFGQTEEAIFQKLPLIYMHENGVLWGCFEKRFTAYLQNQRHQKTSSTYIHKIGVLATLFRAMFIVCLQKSCFANCPLT